MHFQSLSTLEDYLSEVEAVLLSKARRVTVTFPPSAVSPWDRDALELANKELLKRISNKANLYAIYTAQCGAEKHTLKYIGKTKKKYARERIKNHLFHKHEDTGAKLAEIMAHTCNGGTVELAWIEVSPESLRNYLEEELIARHPEASWNRENQ
ncbi:hypothetical protein [Achromobacter sp.]|uniref:hypothetical protein n=1 Tax=Achromobacter sp. TaxID=134375 RepID=UPI0028A125AD|nr:hypothetical protein [Achromobacter sp.]